MVFNGLLFMGHVKKKENTHYPQQAIKTTIPVLSTSLYSKNSDPAAEAGMAHGTF
jgi:hypothetical protein